MRAGRHPEDRAQEAGRCATRSLPPLVPGLPSVVAPIVGAGLIAGWRGRSTAAGLPLGSLFGPVDVVAAGLLPAGGVVVRPDTRCAAAPAIA